MTIKKGKTGFSSRVRISALRLHRQIRRIYAIVADINELGETVSLGNDAIFKLVVK